VLDGEIVALDEQPPIVSGPPAPRVCAHAIVFYAFDLLHLDGQDLTQRPLTERRARLSTVFTGSGLRLSETLPGTATQVTQAVARLGLEGVIAKRADSRYHARLGSGAWVKLKLDRQQEFVVGGYRPSGLGVDALLVGYYERTQLRCAAMVRAGLAPPLRDALGALIHRCSGSGGRPCSRPWMRPSCWSYASRSAMRGSGRAWR
jgi:bifunctional non-homologous end joining protein LigD